MMKAKYSRELPMEEDIKEDRTTIESSLFSRNDINIRILT